MRWRDFISPDYLRSRQDVQPHEKIGSMDRYGPRIGRKMRYEALKVENESKGM